MENYTSRKNNLRHNCAIGRFSLISFKKIDTKPTASRFQLSCSVLLLLVVRVTILTMCFLVVSGMFKECAKVRLSRRFSAIRASVRVELAAAVRSCHNNDVTAHVCHRTTWRRDVTRAAPLRSPAATWPTAADSNLARRGAKQQQQPHKNGLITFRFPLARSSLPHIISRVAHMPAVVLGLLVRRSNRRHWKRGLLGLALGTDELAHFPGHGRHLHSRHYAEFARGLLQKRTSKQQPACPALKNNSNYGACLRPAIEIGVTVLASAPGPAGSCFTGHGRIALLSTLYGPRASLPLRQR